MNSLTIKEKRSSRQQDILGNLKLKQMYFSKK